MDTQFQHACFSNAVTNAAYLATLKINAGEELSDGEKLDLKKYFEQRLTTVKKQIEAGKNAPQRKHNLKGNRMGNPKGEFSRL